MNRAVHFIVDEDEKKLCYAKGSSSNRDSVCLLMQRLNAGDQVYVKFVGSGNIRLNKSFFQGTFLYKTD